MYDEIDFSDLKPIEIPIKNLLGKNYILKEASGDAAVKYRNVMMKCAKMGADMEIKSLDGLADCEPLLVSLCMYEVTSTGLVPVSIATVRAWPAKVQKKLFEVIKDISDLDDRKKSVLPNRMVGLTEEQAQEEGESAFKEKLKNGLNATTVGSV